MRASRHSRAHPHTRTPAYLRSLMPVRFTLPADHPHVALVTLDRPERANALDPAMLCELAAAWRRIAADEEIRCAVLTGSGQRAFCAGMDMRATIPLAQALARGERIRRIARSKADCLAATAGER